MDLTSLLTLPAVQGVILGQLKVFLQTAFQNIDNSGAAQAQAKWLQPALVVLTLITSAVSLALQGQLHTLDVSALQTYVIAAVNMYLGAQASQAAGSKTTTALAAKVSGK